MATAVGRVKLSKPSKDDVGTLAWNVALLFPMQGEWSEYDYLAFERQCGNRMVELADGCLEVLPQPTLKHQRIVKWMVRKIDDFVLPQNLGETAMAPLPVRLFQGRIREPDIMYFKARRILDADKQLVDGADLVMEVPSRGRKNRERDLQIKRHEHAKAQIPEYWLIDPETKAITVLTLVGKTYKVLGVFKPGDHAGSKLLKGFKVAVTEAFAAGEGR